MRIAVHLEQKRFFRNAGYISFEEIFSENEGISLLKAIHKHLKDKNHDARFSYDIYKLLPEITALLQKRMLGRIAVELSGRNSLSLVGDCFVEHPCLHPLLSSEESLEHRVLDVQERVKKMVENTDGDCYLMLYLNSKVLKGCGVYFKTSLPEENALLYPGDAVLCLAFSDRRGSGEYPLFK